MNKFSKNFLLLKDDLIYFFKRQPKEDFAKINKKEVLLLYRHLLKTVPQMQKDLLEKKYHYEVKYP
jgi:hypothetical protein